MAGICHTLPYVASHPKVLRRLNKLAKALANVVNRQPASFQFAYDLEAVNFQDVEISMIRRAVLSFQCLNDNLSEELGLRDVNLVSER